MIRSFGNKETARVLEGAWSRSFPPDIKAPTVRRLRYLDRASTLADLLSPPGNRLEQLKGDMQGRYSARINDQWRITFRWSDGGADDVRIEDYHR